MRRLVGRWRWNKKGGERAQSLVELALVLPILLVLIVGIADIGSAYNAYLTVIDSGREGARLGSKGLATDTQIRQLVTNDMSRLTTSFNATTGVTISRNTMPGDQSVKVKVCYDHPLILPFPSFLSNPIHMCSTTTMRAISY